MTRLLPLLILLFGAWAKAHNAPDFDDPATTIEARNTLIFFAALGGAALAFSVGALLATLSRMRRSDSQAPEAATVRARQQTWMTVYAVTAVVGAVVSGFAAASLLNFRQSRETEFSASGHGTRWDFQYGGGVRTSSELVVPVGKLVRLKFTAGDGAQTLALPVVGRFQAEPGVIKNLEFVYDRPGVYAPRDPQAAPVWVVALEADEFERFMAAARNYTPPAIRGDAALGQQVFEVNCASCHRVQGSTARGVIGPDLSYFAQRHALGNGIPHTPGAVRDFLRGSGSAEGDRHAPPLHLEEPHLNAVVAYLEALRLEGIDFAALPRR
ncbi:cytochrome c oxidase subunit 2 [Deinobacterium chartae]|uniref:Cytochrome c oxidase subunit 2 n=1 Tax=Deinobacterium chartae TaxID=521158 RepID=A0A841HVP9_9DEIO|nr:c-type cytochrome [Deinobacterium chartae]MBB6097467.1 cytochrome c oxidase subunit 2 [Deinobacterium chartae]